MKREHTRLSKDTSPIYYTGRIPTSGLTKSQIRDADPGGAWTCLPVRYGGAPYGYKYDRDAPDQYQFSINLQPVHIRPPNGYQTPLRLNDRRRRGRHKSSKTCTNIAHDRRRQTVSVVATRRTWLHPFSNTANQYLHLERSFSGLIYFCCLCCFDLPLSHPRRPSSSRGS